MPNGHNLLMSLNEADTRAKLIDPALRERGWTEDHIFREQTAGAIDLIGGRARQRAGKIDYVLRVRMNPGTQPITIALIEAKAESYPPTHGLEQVKAYAKAHRFHVPFVFSSNGHQFVCFDSTTGLTADPKLIKEFPSPTDLLNRWQAATQVNLGDPRARGLLAMYRHGESGRRYYQDAAIRSVLEKVARGDNRALIAVATGAGKTYIAVQLLRRLFDAGLVKRALFVCDRDELRTQGLTAFTNVFGGDAAEVFKRSDGTNNAANARVHVATFQTLGIEGEEADASFLRTHYPENYFDAVVIDECHRSAWGKWSEVLKRNRSAIQVGLTATPREIEGVEMTTEDKQITADNVTYFGEPAYEYSITQGVEDGYLAACEIIRRDIFLAGKTANERETGLDSADIREARLVDPNTGQPIELAEDDQAHYDAENFEQTIQIPERVRVMAEDFFHYLLATGGPHQKTIVFCVRDHHADEVAIALNNLYVAWCRNQGVRPLQDYAFKCTAEAGGSKLIPLFKDAPRSHFIATTVDLLSTGVDVPAIRNIVFNRFIRSPILFYQMVGRGTRLDPLSDKLMFRIYDYTDASRLFGHDFLSRAPVVSEPSPPAPPEGEGEAGADGTGVIRAEGVEVRIRGAGRFILTVVDGKEVPVTLEAYREMLAAKIADEAPDLAAFRAIWVDPDRRRHLLANLPESGKSAEKLRLVEGMTDYDLYDVLGSAAYGLDPRTKPGRADAFLFKARTWLDDLPLDTAATVKAMARQFGVSGTDALESLYIFQVPEVRAAGGLDALKRAGAPRDLLTETKKRMFAA
jgi:type I restriction enzyme, R subunit